MLVKDVEKSKKKNIYNFFSKLKNGEDTVITVVVKTSFKYLIRSAICVGVLQLDFLTIFGLHVHKIEFV